MSKLKELIREQTLLASKVSLQDYLPTPLSTIAGVDVTFLDPQKPKTTALAAIVVLSYPELKVRDKVVVKETVSFPYLPGFLAFREFPAVKKAYEKLATKADIYLVDGQGIAHPRASGIASHMGVMLNIPTIGCAKSLLYGNFDPTALKANLPAGGASSPLLDKFGDEIGVVVRPKGGSQLIFVSPGHMVSVKSAAEIVKKLFIYSLPEPIRIADILLREERRKELGQRSLL